LKALLTNGAAQPFPGYASGEEQRYFGREHLFSLRDPQRLYAGQPRWVEDIVRAAWRHAEVGRNDRPTRQAES
jgi:hypothetical protein